MNENNTLVRSMHDLGLAAWFGGSLMGAIGLNGAASHAADPKERLTLSSKGWGMWSPVNAAAIGAHVVGSLGLIAANKSRLALQPGAQLNTVVKSALTVFTAGVTAYSGVLGAKVAKQAKEGEGGEGATEPEPTASKKLSAAQGQLKALQWAIPALTGTLVVLAAQQGEQQRYEPTASRWWSRRHH
ncbi:hypothetical protein [Georgenia sp. SUBG003]|uniref:hypothetical protein n=1 Tax=Georgenia sp. SUBG003 TaxID=1497974 RepID=UPI0004D7DF1B|nr:hypothetical protein DA06_15115 [Georgenia sp. SUBG003]